MKTINFKTHVQGHQKQRSYSVTTKKDVIIGHFDYNLNIFINNKGIINKCLKFNGNTSRGVYNSLFYNYKQVK